MNTLQTNLQENILALKKQLSSEDILTYSFSTQDNVPCALIYADGMVNKQLLGELVARPLSFISLKPAAKDGQNTKNDGGRVAMKEKCVMENALFPELKILTKTQDMIKEVLDGNTLLLVDTLDVGFIIGAKFIPIRAVMEPPTDIAVKGPREGFIEDIKTNMALIRKRLKTL